MCDFVTTTHALWARLCVGARVCLFHNQLHTLRVANVIAFHLYAFIARSAWRYSRQKSLLNTSCLDAYKPHFSSLTNLFMRFHKRREND